MCPFLSDTGVQPVSAQCFYPYGLTVRHFFPPSSVWIPGKGSGWPRWWEVEIMPRKEQVRGETQQGLGLWVWGARLLVLLSVTKEELSKMCRAKERGWWWLEWLSFPEDYASFILFCHVTVNEFIISLIVVSLDIFWKPLFGSQIYYIWHVMERICLKWRFLPRR